ncbi:MAG: hypothetical protein WC343_09330 [Bacilli bacterium]|jgi:hypothetical protein
MIGTEDLALLVWLTFIAVGVVCIYTILADAATLSMTGSCTGHGICNLTVEADIISANVSQAINCSSWNIVAGGI